MATTNLPEMFGSLVFNDDVMKNRLPEQTYNEFKACVEQDKPLSFDIAHQVASAMKSWALENGATHYTHWFQPMTGITAEKHDSFLSPAGGCKINMDFSGKELICSEPDASSFPSGGIRSTFEARGYTAWDPTSYTFIKDDTLCIPSIFYSYGGQVLDKKTPLLRSVQALDTQAMRIVNIFGNPTDAKHVKPSVGGEQEYFLLDRDLYNKREDLVMTGRTLFGAKPPKGQEMNDHYFGTIKPRVKAFMNDLDNELWKLGVYAKTEHNEAAPSQHELAPVFSDVNTATDQNQLTMEIMKTVAIKHGLALLIHEKPFAGVNGSGKHNNWSITTDTGVNLFKPGKKPQENTQFLLILAAIIKGVDEYQELLRCSIASPGNDHRLGDDEAPPAIVSLYLGDELASLETAIEHNERFVEHKKKESNSGVNVIPNFSQDNTDRNRTSPFAFTGNRFEFRMVGSSDSLAGPNTVLNTMLAEELCQFADMLEGTDNVERDARKIISDVFKKHSRIIFNGNNYSEEWVKEAERRGLSNIPHCSDAFKAYLDPKNIALFEKHHIYTEEEMHSRYEISVDNYCKKIHIEALTMIEMIRKDIIPAVTTYMNEISETLMRKQKINDMGGNISYNMEQELLERLSNLSDLLFTQCDGLEESLDNAEKSTTYEERAEYYKSTVHVAMHEARVTADHLETITAKKYWPFPTYSDLLYSVV